MEYNNELEIIDTEHKSYLLGLLFSDGCITNNNVTRLSLVDEQIINDLYKSFNFFNLNSFDFSIYNKLNKIQYSLSKKNIKLQQDLLEHGMLFRKSTENAYRFKLPTKIPLQLMNHFIRGYFDGNGSIYIPSLRPNLRRIEICSSSETFINDIKTYLESINIKCPYYREKKNTKSILYVLEWIKQEDIFIIKDFLYNNSTIYLNRKKEIFDSFKIINKTDNNPKCKICGENLKKSGSRKTEKGLSLRYKCTHCKKAYSYPVSNKKLDELLEHPKALITINELKNSIKSDNIKDNLMGNQQPS